MERLTEARFMAQLAEFDAAVDRSAGIDRFCSCSDWVLPAHTALMPARRFYAARAGDTWIVGAVRVLADGMRLFEPLEASWALASGIVGVDNAGDALQVARYLTANESKWDAVLVAGLLAGSDQLKWIATALAARVRLHLGEPTPRYVVDLDGGVEAFLSRRSRNFRRSLSRSMAKSTREGVVVVAEHASDEEGAASVFARILDVESRSWKGLEGAGITEGAMREFYRLMAVRLAVAGRLRCWFAVRDGRDLGYVLGGVRGDWYRGLQFSYDDSAAALGLGNVMQLEQMRALVDEGIRRYDLGSEAAYKARWADRVLRSPVVFALGR